MIGKKWRQVLEPLWAVSPLPAAAPPLTPALSPQAGEGERQRARAERTKQKQPNAGLKAAETKGAEAARHKGLMGAWTRKHGKNDVLNNFNRSTSWF